VARHTMGNNNAASCVLYGVNPALSTSGMRILHAVNVQDNIEDVRCLSFH
jgi:hypothetical protein